VRSLRGSGRLLFRGWRGIAALGVIGAVMAAAVPVIGQELATPDPSSSSSGPEPVVVDRPGRKGSTSVAERGPGSVVPSVPDREGGPGGVVPATTDGSLGGRIDDFSPKNSKDVRQDWGNEGTLEHTRRLKGKGSSKGRGDEVSEGDTPSLPGLSGKKLVARGPNYEVVQNANGTKTAVVGAQPTNFSDSSGGTRRGRAIVGSK
jgi:hypothetical protein